MNCINFRVRSKNYEKYVYCTLKKEKISYQECIGCKYKEYKEVKKLSSNKKSTRSKQTDISSKVKQKVYARDNGCCIICGNKINTMPNAHYISRANGGLGIEENIGTMCTELTENKCHRKYDFGTKEEREEIKRKFKAYLKSMYPNWNEEGLIYKKIKEL